MNISYLYGVLDSDGYLNKRTYAFQMGVIDKEFAEEVKKNIEAIIDKEVAIYEYQRTSKTYFIDKASKELYKLIRNTERNELITEPYLRGLFDGDGNFQKDTRKDRSLVVRLRITDKKIINFAYEKLKEIGIKSIKFEREKKGKKKVFGLKFQKRKYRKIFFEKVGSSIPRKRKALKKSLEPKYCKVCGKELPVVERGCEVRKYCSPKCRNKARNKRRREGKGIWSEEEVERLKALYSKFGCNYKKISQKIEGRTERAVQGKVYSLNIHKRIGLV